MIRRLFTVASVLSLLLCGVSVVLWVRSTSHEDDLIYQPGHPYGWMWWFNSYNGRIQLLLGEDAIPEFRTAHLRLTTAMVETPGWDSFHVAYAGGAGFGIGTTTFGHFDPSAAYSGTGPMPYVWVQLHCVKVPYWSIALATSALPLVWLRGYLRRALRQRRQRCIHCGYDLRASTDRCPECGTPVPTKAESTA